jgi:hypothetical protein
MENARFLLWAGMMTAASVAFQIGLATGHFKSYEWAMSLLWGAAFGLFVAWLTVTFTRSRADDPRGRSQPPHNEQRVEANPQQIVQIGGDLFPKLLQQSPPVPRKPEAKPNIKFVGAQTLEGSLSQGRFLGMPFSGNGPLLLTTVCFRNEAIIDQTPKQPQVNAHLIYRDSKQREITDASHVAWIEERKDRAAFDVGKKKCLLVFLRDPQGLLAKAWIEEYHSEHSWMGGPSYRHRFASIPQEEVAAILIQLLDFWTGACLAEFAFDVEWDIETKIPTLKPTSQLG